MVRNELVVLSRRVVLVGGANFRAPVHNRRGLFALRKNNNIITGLTQRRAGGFEDGRLAGRADVASFGRDFEVLGRPVVLKKPRLELPNASESV